MRDLKDVPDVKEFVRETYAKAALSERGLCSGSDLVQLGQAIGYSPDDLSSVPEGANLGLGCGNPLAMASLRAGETVLDLGSGAGFDCFLAAQRVGPGGRIIGVDMTPEMIAKARANAAKGGYANVEFRQGDIEALPVENESVDAVISNCVLNLVPDKARAFGEIFRVLKPGGRMMVSDIVLNRELPAMVKQIAELYAACVTGAILKDEYLRLLGEAGFEQVAITGESDAAELLRYASDPLSKMLRTIGTDRLKGWAASVKVRALKPAPVEA
jgi:arsenite methyltransferase